MKEVIISGCSYGVFQSPIIELYKKEKNTNHKISELESIIDLHMASTGATYQTLSTIICIEELLKNELINTEDVFVICEFSEIKRKEFLIRNDFIKNIIDSEITKNENNAAFMYSFIYENIDFAKSNKMHDCLKNIFLCKGKSFLNTNDTYIASLLMDNNLSDVIKNLFDSKINWNIDFANRALNYFNNILYLQTYLKNKNIKYKFLFISNQIDCYNDSGNQFQFKTTNDFNMEKAPDNFNNTIFDSYSYIKPFELLIDWENFWLHENINGKYGGIDEYAIDTYNINAFDLNTRNLIKSGIDSGKISNLFNRHPEMNPTYFDLINKII